MGKTDDKVRDLQSQLETQVADLVTGDDWSRMLDTASRFHRYSPGNVMLIMRQKPDATRVAGFQAWKGMGRSVKKGEKAIRVLAPCRYKKIDETGEESWRIGGFTTACVFDISQTEGKPIADVRPVLLDGDAPVALWQNLAAQVSNAGFRLVASTGAIGGANGVTSYLDRTVTIRGDASTSQQCKTLAHELGHILLEHEKTLGECRGLKEVEAESVAYIVSAYSGLSTEGYSLPYVAAWAGGDVKAVRATAEHVVRVASLIIAAIETAEEEEVAA